MLLHCNILKSYLICSIITFDKALLRFHALKLMRKAILRLLDNSKMLRFGKYVKMTSFDHEKCRAYFKS